MLTAKTVGTARSLSRSWTHPQLGVTSAQRCGLSSIFFDHLFTVPTLRPRQCLFQSFGAISPPAKVKIPPPNGCQIVCSESLLAGAMNYKYITKTFF